MADRTPRTTETREADTRKRTWERPSALPVPPSRPGKKFRWVRTSMMGDSDNRNVSMRFREGYVPVKAKDYPEMQVLQDLDSRFPDNIEVGGLLLCVIDEEIAKDRERQQLAAAQTQMDAVDRNYMRESDPRMPVLPPERSTRTTFGKG
jgi:hypothetical protein